MENPPRPSYLAALVAQLAVDGRIVATARVVQWLANHGYDAAEQLVTVLSLLSERGRFTGSCTLVNGAVADEYVVTLADGEWYLKFWVDEGQRVVNVWSCCWDGAVH